jgi:hypothetical protein
MLTTSLCVPFSIKRAQASLTEKTISASASKKATAPIAAKAQEQKSRWREGELLIRFSEHVPVSKMNALLRANGAQWAGRRCLHRAPVKAFI